MEEGSFRCDANISLRPLGSDRLGTKTEIKNMNSFRAVERALAYEVERQRALLERGEQVEQETRGWVEDRGVTVPQRTKEYAHDYRYFPEPDLPPMVLAREWVEELRARLPELPDARRERFMRQYALSHYDAAQLAAEKSVAELFEGTVARGFAAKTVANWVQGEVFRLLNESGKELEQTPLTVDHLAELLALVERGTISGTAAKAVLEETFQTGERPGAVVERRGLTQISDAEALRATVAEVLAANPQAVSDYRAGKTTAINFLKGQVMKATRGKANQAVAERLLREALDGR